MEPIREDSKLRGEVRGGPSRRPSHGARVRLPQRARRLASAFFWMILVAAFASVVGSQPKDRAALPTYVSEHAFANAAAAQALEPGGVEEGQLHEYEAGVLGEEHAAEHAEQREALQSVEATGQPGADESAQAEASALDPAAYGEWEAPFPIPVLGINAIMLPTGKVLLFAYPLGYTGVGGVPTSRAYVWDPARGTGEDAFRRVDPPVNPDTGYPANIWCAGNSLLPDGRVLVAGGNLKYRNQTGGNFAGLDRLYTFNPWDETWTEQPRMRKGRWYPSQLLMPDGRTVIMHGLDETGTGAINRDFELFTPSADPNGRGTLNLLGPPDVLGQPGQPPIGAPYPHMVWMPSGRGLIAGHAQVDSWFLNRPAPVANPSLSWSDAPDPSQTRMYGTAVLLPGPTSGSTRVQQVGGHGGAAGSGAVATSETFDEARPGAGWVADAPLNVARSNHNTVLLPDRSMVAVGGGVGSDPNMWTSSEALKQIELYDPSTNSWRLGPAQAENRAYHSTALLLPDGRVFSAGDDVNGGTESDTAEIYEPPYLFKGPRPEISSAPDAIRAGNPFEVATPDAISRAVLVAPGAVTHATDMNQRHVELRVADRLPGSGVTLDAPPNLDVAPPGYYMLFLLNEEGVPSVAKFVRLGGTAPAYVPPPPPPPPPPPNTAPVVLHPRPAPNSSTRDVTPLIGATVRDAQTDLSKSNIRFYVDGRRYTTFGYNRATDRLSYASRRLTPGVHAVKIIATDAQGRSAVRSWRFRIG